MIIIGYQGIGKSSLAGRFSEYIDLESSNWNNAALKKAKQQKIYQDRATRYSYLVIKKFKIICLTQKNLLCCAIRRSI